jgi:hypothetical protein
MQRILDTTQFKKAVFILMNWIEEDKDHFLENYSVGKFSTSVNKKLTEVNPALCRFGLVPVTDSMPLGLLLQVVSQKPVSGIKSESDLKSFAFAEKFAVILIRKITPVPIEYNLRNLINRGTGELIQDEKSGISKKTIERFATINYVTCAGSAKDAGDTWDFSITVVGDREAESFYVFETLDGCKYRGLVPWINAQNFLLPRFRIASLLKYVASGNKAGRVTNYQALANAKITEGMFLTKTLSTEELEERADEYDTHAVKNDIFVKVSGWLHEYIHKNIKKIKTPTAINDLIHRTELFDLFVQALQMNYTQINSQRAAAGVDKELLSTFLLSTETLSRRFMKELHDGYNRSPLDEAVFKLSAEERSNKIIEKLDFIVLDIVNNLISVKSNMFSGLFYKRFLFGLAL